MAESISEKFFWVGVHDREEDRVFRFLNGTIYDPSNKDEDHLYHWDEGIQKLIFKIWFYYICNGITSYKKFKQVICFSLFINL